MMLYDLTDRSFAMIAFAFLSLVGSSTEGQVVNEDAKLLASDAAANDNFGGEVAIGNGMVIVGSHADDDNGSASGSAYFFDATTGLQLSKLTPSDGAPSAFFGTSVAVDAANNLYAFGSSNDVADGSFSGSVYVYFDFGLGIGSFLESKLFPTDGSPGDEFGASVAIDDGVVVVGAPGDDDNGDSSGSVYLYLWVTGEQLYKLHPSDGSPGDEFGASVAIDDGIVVVGARYDQDNGEVSGSAYLFDATTGTQIAKLLPDDGDEADLFGTSVAIGNGVVAVGAWGNDDQGSSSGSVYLFDASTGAQLRKILPSDGRDFGEFGRAVAINNGLVVVGASTDNNNTDVFSGSAYLFDMATGAELLKYVPSDGTSFGFFGSAVAIDGGVVAVGARLDDANGVTNSGSVYLFPETAPCTVDLTGDGQIDIFDVFAYLDLFNQGDLAADFTGDGSLDIFDVFAFLDAFNAGCS